MPYKPLICYFLVKECCATMDLYNCVFVIWQIRAQDLERWMWNNIFMNKKGRVPGEAS